MRVATYTQRSAPSRGSVFALFILVLTILMGSGVVPTQAVFIGGPFARLMTPVWFFLYLSAAFGLMFNHGINWISWLVRYRILLVVLLLGTMVSVSWSIDAKVSAERVVHLLGTSLLAIYIGFSMPLLTTLRVFAVVMAFFVVGSIAAALALPVVGLADYEGIQVWRGVFNSKNDLGFWAAVGVLLYITLSDSTETLFAKLLCFMLAGLCLALLALSQSATSLLAMVIAGTLSLYFFIAGRFQLGFIRMVILALLFTGVIGMAIANINTAELVGRSGDLTGRGEVWKQVWKLILERPLTGVGYGSLWFPTDDTIWIQQMLTDFTWVVYHAHNGFLQIASEIGLPLAVVALLMVAQQLIEIFYCQYERQQVGVLFVLAFVTTYLISNYSEARFLVTRELFWIFFLALPISMLRQINIVSLDPYLDDEYDDRPGVYPSGYSGNRPGSRPYTADRSRSDDHSRDEEPYVHDSVPGKPWLEASAQQGHAQAADGQQFRARQAESQQKGGQQAGRQQAGNRQAGSQQAGNQQAGNQQARGRQSTGPTQAGRTQTGRTQAGRTSVERNQADRHQSGRSQTSLNQTSRNQAGRTGGHGAAAAGAAGSAGALGYHRNASDSNEANSVVDPSVLDEVSLLDATNIDMGEFEVENLKSGDLDDADFVRAEYDEFDELDDTEELDRTSELYDTQEIYETDAEGDVLADAMLDVDDELDQTIDMQAHLNLDDIAAMQAEIDELQDPQRSNKLGKESLPSDDRYDKELDLSGDWEEVSPEDPKHS